MSKYYGGVRSQKKAQAILSDVRQHVLTQKFWSQDDIKKNFKVGHGTVLIIADMLVESGTLRLLSDKSASRKYYEVVEKRDEPVRAETQVEAKMEITEEPVVRERVIPRKDWRTEYFKLKFSLDEDDILEIVEAYSDYYE